MGPEDIESLLDYEYGQTYLFSVLAILYPTLDYRNKFHVDHIFPKHVFTASKLKNRGVPDDQVWSYILKRDSLANLQLLEGLPNQEKSGKDFDKWLLETFPDEDERRDYLRKHYLPETDMNIGNFLQVFAEREERLRKQLVRVLISPST